jgi:hypothetical protein
LYVRIGEIVKTAHAIHWAHRVARAATHPGFLLAALADQLREVRDGLDGFDGGDTATAARAVFSWSYHSLGAPAARLFRLLGLHPGPDVTAGAAASLAGRSSRCAHCWPSSPAHTWSSSTSPAGTRSMTRTHLRRLDPPAADTYPPSS